MLIIEHDVALASISDRMIALDLGEIVSIGDTEHVVHHPAVVASYLGVSRAAIERSGAQGALLEPPSPD